VQLGFADGAGAAAHFCLPFGIVVDRHFTVYVHSFNHCISGVAPVAGFDHAPVLARKPIRGTLGPDFTQMGTLCTPSVSGSSDVAAADARFRHPRGLVRDAEGKLIVADKDSHCTRKAAVADGQVTTVAGSRAQGRGGGARGL